MVYRKQRRAIDFGQGVKDSARNLLITATLNDLVDPDGSQKYDKRLRPNYGRAPVDVGITIHVSSISAVSEVEMDYTLDIYLRQTWIDPRLRFDPTSIGKELTIGLDYIKKIWVPDTFFPNEKKSFFHEATTHNSFIRINDEGEVMTSQRLTVTATCPMRLHLFPLDSQECTLEIESYGYSEKDIRYRWKKGEDSISKADIRLPQFDLGAMRIRERSIQLSTGIYSRLVTRFMFSRNIGFYLIQVYLPSILIVIISWVSFWLSRDATPARVALGVTTVLTMTTLMTTTNSAMPKVSYVKSIDIYLMACFFLVFASLLEYAVVGYMNKRLRMTKESRLQRQAGTIGGPSVSYFQGKFSSIGGPPSAPKHKMYPAGSDSDSAKMMMPHEEKNGSNYGQNPAAPLLYSNANLPSTNLDARNCPPRADSMAPECDCDIEQGQAIRRIQLNPVKAGRKAGRKMKRRYGGPNPSGIDKYSRIFFPAVFIVFNAVYWSVSLHLSARAKGKALASGA